MAKDDRFDLDKLKSMGDCMDRLFDEWMNKDVPLLMLGDKMWAPAVDVSETSDSLIILVELAGVPKDNVKVAIKDEVLKISGFRSDPLGSKRVRLHRLEIMFGKFERFVPIPIPVEEERISAVMENGVLTITIPKIDMIREIPISDE